MSTTLAPPRVGKGSKLATAEALLEDVGLPIVATLGVLLGFQWGGHLEGSGPFGWLEVGVLAVVAWTSTGNYKRTFDHLQNLGEGTKHFARRTPAAANVLWFFTATYFFSWPALHLASIALIYGTFCWTNLQHINTLSPAVEKSGASPKAKARLAETLSWIQDENGPSLVGYVVVNLLLVALAYYYSERSGDWLGRLKAYSGGAATFHLSLSVLRYRQLLGSADMLGGVLQRVSWQGKKKAELDPNVWLGKCAKNTLRKWKNVLYVLVVASVVIAALGRWIKDAPESPVQVKPSKETQDR